jgi:uncharacterized membrane protein
MSSSSDRSFVARGIARWALAGLLAVAGASHLTWGRRGYRIVVPDWATRVGWLVAAFFVAVFPGNVHQWQTGRSAPMMRTDRARFIRLLLQPALVAWALWSTRGR